MQRPSPRRKCQPTTIAQLIAGLDNDDFAVREKATKELERQGREVEDNLRKALEDQPPAELRKRAEELLKKFPRRGRQYLVPLHLREIRAVQVFEWIGTPEACRALEALVPKE